MHKTSAYYSQDSYICMNCFQFMHIYELNEVKQAGDVQCTARRIFHSICKSVFGISYCNNLEYNMLLRIIMTLFENKNDRNQGPTFSLNQLAYVAYFVSERYYNLFRVPAYSSSSNKAWSFEL